VTVRRATLADLETLVDLRVAFVRELSTVDDEDMLRSKVAAYLARTIPSEGFLVWVVEEDGPIVAMAGMVIYERMMGRGGVGTEGYVLSVYTIPERRKQGHGARVMEALQSYAASKDIRLTLIATDGGRPLYEKLGWKHDDRNYRWFPE
jgi:GNAT superfamily N-acetyltransferase